MLPESFGYRASRRRLLLGVTVLAVGPVLQACGAAPAAPTPGPAAPAQPVAPTATTAAAQPAAAQPTTAAPPTATVAAATTPPTATPVAVNAATAAGGKATITLWTHDDGLVKFLGNRAAEWIPTKTGWEIKTDFQVVADPPTKELTALAAGQGVPELFGVQVDNFSRFQKGDICVNAFTDIGPLIKEAGGPENFVKLSIYSWKDKNYAVDWASSPVVYFYREDLFQEAGVKLPIETFDDLINEGQKVKAKGRFMDQFFLEPTFWIAEFSRFLEGRNGLGVFDKDGKVLLDSPEAIDTLQLLSDLSHKHKLLDVFDTGNAQVAGYQRNLVAGTVMADWWAHYVMAQTVKDQVGKWRAQAMPQQVKGVSSTPSWGGIGTTVYQKAPNRDLLLDFIKYSFLTKEHMVKVWTEIGFLPTMRSTWTLPDVVNFANPTLGDQKWGTVVAKAASTLVDPYYGPFWNEHIPIMGKAVNAVLVDNAKPDVALKAAAKDLRDLIAKG
jgi:ABC-type glycerol-3-phosphate transport system substrate-binding protein